MIFIYMRMSKRLEGFQWRTLCTRVQHTCTFIAAVKSDTSVHHSIAPLVNIILL